MKILNTLTDASIQHTLDVAKLEGKAASAFQPRIVAGTSTTARTTAAKVVTIAGYTLTAGDFLAITFSDGFSVASPTLNVNSTGAVSIFCPRGVAVSTADISAGSGVSTTLMLYYDGTYFWTMGAGVNTTYSEITTAEIDAGTASTGRLITARRMEYAFANKPPIGAASMGENTIGFDERDNGNSGTSKTIDWTKSNHQKVTMTGNCTFAFTAPAKPCALSLRFINDGTTGRNITLPTIKWQGGTAPVWTKVANAIDILNLYYDGSAYYGMASLDWK